jgi:hypothetical protein
MGASSPAARAYLRHPSDVPIEIHAQPIQERVAQRLMDVSLGGLACRSECEMDVGTSVEVCIELVSPPFQAEGRVAWCRHRNGYHELGIQFLQHEDAFAARMVEQLCHIEHYRNEVMRLEGRVLDAEAAAEEWISKYAAGFPGQRRFLSE